MIGAVGLLVQRGIFAPARPSPPISWEERLSKIKTPASRPAPPSSTVRLIKVSLAKFRLKDPEAGASSAVTRSRRSFNKPGSTRTAPTRV